MTGRARGQVRVLRGAAPAAFVLAALPTRTNDSLRDALAGAGWRAGVVPPNLAAVAARPGDLVVGRLDVRPTLDGIQPGLERLRELGRRGVRLINDAEAIVACHDKLVTALLFRRASVPQPAGFHAVDPGVAPAFPPPYVVKPRFGSWGRDVVRCQSRTELRACLHAFESRRWFRRHGALIQELIPPRGYDLRLVVAGGRIVGAVERVAAAGEWRTNIALGGRRRPAEPTRDTCDLAIRAAEAVGGDIVGVDLLPDEAGWRVIEVNGAVEFNQEYALREADVFALAVESFVAPAPVAASI
jgi:[lysine-biosynthesis-protein LysW]--L-2-aminoadipate ligase